MNKIKLPKGDEFYCLNKSEASLLYTDLFEQRSYFQFGIVIGAGTTVVDVGAEHWALRPPGQPRGGRGACLLA